MRVDVITLFPALFEGVLAQSMLKRAREKGLLNVVLTDPREFTTDRHRSVDDRPFGGGPGMVLKAGPVVKAVRAARALAPDVPGRLLLTCPRGRVFSQALARELSLEPRLILLAGHYEGLDERIAEILKPEALSIGDYVLTGGELPALVVIDAVARLLPGVLGDEASAECESFAPGNAGLLEYPQYTRPAVFEGHAVPEVLLSGDHAKIEAWRRSQARALTRKLRPELAAETEAPTAGAGKRAALRKRGN